MNKNKQQRLDILVAVTLISLAVRLSGQFKFIVFLAYESPDLQFINGANRGELL